MCLSPHCMGLTCRQELHTHDSWGARTLSSEAARARTHGSHTAGGPPFEIIVSDLGTGKVFT